MPRVIAGPVDAARKLVDCTTRVLESMFFASVFDEIAEAGFVWEPMIGARVSFEGPVHGDLAVAATPQTAHTLACGFLAHDSPTEVEPGRIGETLAELANMICGATLSSMDEEGLFTLAHPQAGPDAVACAVSGGGIRRLLDIGEGTLIVSLTFTARSDNAPSYAISGEAP